ncbi:MAG TPA: YraN family protein [Stellaceae bacterium]|nr:YraN family protein [Stellaceae bacterium]
MTGRPRPITPRRSRQAAEIWGRWAERLCVWHLRLSGWRILARGYRVPVGEIDIIARRRGVLALIEVKARPGWGTAAEAITPRQQRRIGRAAQLFLVQHPRHAGLDLRFDAMLVVPWRLPRHLRQVWLPPE